MRRFGLAMIVLLAVAIVPGCARTVAALSPATVPATDLPGWKRVFADDFTGNRLSAEWTPYSGQPGGDPASYFEPGHVTVENGVLNIRASYDDTRRRWVTGGVSTVSGLSRTYGKYEVRFRADKGRGIAYSLLLWPRSDTWPPEVDFAQDNGDQRKRLYATLHAIGGGQVQRSITGDFTAWHTVGVEWTPDRLAYTLDGRTWAKFHDDRVPRQPMSLVLQAQAWYCGHDWERCPDSTTPRQLDLQVDWVVVYARRPAVA